jgi:ABC-type transport system substrate-binding protein
MQARPRGGGRVWSCKAANLSSDQSLEKYIAQWALIGTLHAIPESVLSHHSLWSFAMVASLSKRLWPLAAAQTLALALALSSGALQAETVARYGISMIDIPLTTGQPDRGAGAYQFTGHTIYDPLIAWEANIGTRPGKLVPGLATAWKVDPKDNKVWRFTLRKGVKFHDGADFKADAVIWNLDKVLNDKSPQYDAKQAAQVRPRIPSVASYRQIDDYTVEITTKDIDALFPYQLPWFLVGSPARWDKLGRDWNKVAFQPSGTGPFKLDKLVPRERAELVKFAGYWDKSRLAKTDRIVLLTMPDALTRFAYSRYIAPNGVNWGGYVNAKVDGAIDKVRTSFDVKVQDRLLAEVHQQMVDEALMLWVVHDTNPHALSPKVKAFVQAQHWFQDLTTIGM